MSFFVGLDVGKGEHHGIALNRTGKRLFDKAIPDDEAIPPAGTVEDHPNRC
jgi:hypothetical protein